MTIVESHSPISRLENLTFAFRGKNDHVEFRQF